MADFFSSDGKRCSFCFDESLDFKGTPEGLSVILINDVYGPYFSRLLAHPWRCWSWFNLWSQTLGGRLHDPVWAPLINYYMNLHYYKKKKSMIRAGPVFSRMISPAEKQLSRVLREKLGRIE